MHRSDSPGFGMMTIFDQVPQARRLPADFQSGEDPALVIYDGLIRGVKVLGRGARPGILLGLKIEPQPEETIVVDIHLVLDASTHAWWRRKFVDSSEVASRLPRHIVVRAFGVPVGGGTIGGEEQETHIICTVPGDLVEPGGLLMLELVDAGITGFETGVNKAPMFGIRVERLRCSVLDDALPSAIHLPTLEQDPRTIQGSVMPRGRDCSLRLQILEKPRLHPRVGQSRVLQPLGRLLRKAGVLARALKRRSFTSPENGHVSWPVTAYDARGGKVRGTAHISEDQTVELEFPQCVAGDVIFFELHGDAQALSRAGYAPFAAFRLMSNPAAPPQSPS